ncbi:MAG: DHH family phosphoesterase [Bacilli bacterium]
MINRKKFKEIFHIIKKYENIVIVRHMGGDPDAIGSQNGLKEILKYKFPKKNIFSAGLSASRLKYLGEMDKLPEDLDNILLLILDTPDKKRVDFKDLSIVNYSIKIDHHPFVEKFCDFEVIDDTSCSTSQMIIEFCIQNKLHIPISAAEKLYRGIMSDTNRLLYSYTSVKTFELLTYLIKTTNLDFTSLYEKLYLRPISEIKFQGFIFQNLNITENGLGYLKLTTDIIKEFGVDPGSAGNMVENLNYIDEVLSWAIFSEDSKNNCIRCTIRSRGPIINEVASKFGGGGHIYASGARIQDFETVDKLIDALDKNCLEYKKGIS